MNESSTFAFSIALIATVLLAASVIWIRRLSVELNRQLENKEKQIQIESKVRSQAQIIDQTHDSVISVDLEGFICNWNKGAEKLFGYQAKEVLGRHVFCIHPEEDYSFIQNELIPELIEKGHYEIETKLLRKSGNDFYARLSLSMIYNEQDDATGMIGFAIDIDENIKAKKALEKFKHTLDQTLDCVFMFDAESLKFTYANEGALQHIGYSYNETLAMHPYDIKPDYNEKEFREMIRLLMQDEKLTLNFETNHRNKDGSIVPVEIFLQYITALDSEPHFISIVRDITEKKKASETVRSSEEQLEKAQALSKIGHWKLIPSTGEMTGSDELFNIFCLPREFSTLESFVDVVYPDDREKVMSAIQKSEDYAESWDITYRLITCDGKKKWLHAIGDAITDEKDNVIELIGTVQDITEQKLVGNEIENSRARFENMFESIPDAVIFIDENNKIKMLNNAFTKIFGYEKLEFLNKEFKNLSVMLDNVESDDLQAIFKQNSYKLKYRCKNGRAFNGETFTRSLVNSAGEELGRIVIVRDISERAHVDAILRSLAASASGLQFETFMHDVLARLCEVYNCPFAFISQLLPDGETVQTLAGRVHGEIVENFEYALADTPCEDIISGKKTLIPVSASKIYAKDRALVDMGVESFFGLPLMTSDGSIIGLLSIMNTSKMELGDWTEPVLSVFATRVSLELERELATRELQRHRHNLEELVAQRTVDLSVARDEAEHANAAKSEFLSHMSHELRTPLNAILGFAQMLELDEKDFNEDQRSDIKEILDAGRHLLMLISEVLDLARIESGSLEITMQPVAVNELLKPCLSLIVPQADARHIEVIDHISKQEHIIQADNIRFKQVLLNLLSNAVKYNRDGGQIILTSQPVGKQHLRISVTDTGNGLSEEEISHLFVNFDRINASSNTEGTGIGLVISKNLVGLMNGVMGVESVPGEGCTFWLELSLADSEREELYG